ncbi:MAG: transporter associated domain-containing protein [Pseudomonadota bacterium]
MNITFKSLVSKLWPFKKLEGDGSIRDTIEELIEETEEVDTSLNTEEKKIIANLLRLKDEAADDICTPRVDITAVALGTSYKDLTQLFAEKAVTRMPVYRDTLDDVVGYIHIRDVLAGSVDCQTVNYEEILQEVLFVAPSMRLMDLLLQMRATRIPMAIVVDEFGGVDGLVTAWNIINEIIGNIEELDGEFPTKASLTRMSDGSFLISARMDIENFEAEFGPVLNEEERSEDEIDTVGGLVVSLAGRVPGIKEIIPHPNGIITFEILEADPRRVKRLRVRLPAKTTPE